MCTRIHINGSSDRTGNPAGKFQSRQTTPRYQSGQTDEGIAAANQYLCASYFEMGQSPAEFDYRPFNAFIGHKQIGAPADHSPFDGVFAEKFNRFNEIVYGRRLNK